MTTVKQTSDFHTSTLVQHVAARYLATDAHERNVRRSVPYYRERRDALLGALERHLAGEVRAAVPRGGHHLWVTLGSPVEERALYAEAVRHGVSFTPGGAVCVERPRPTSFRLSFSLLDPELLDEGVKRLARALRAVRRTDRRGVAAPFS